MNCSKCDAELTESSKFCPSCGTQQTNPIDEGTQVTSATEDKPDSGFLAGYIVFGVMIAGLWWWIGSMESANGLIVSLIFGLWFAFAAFGFHKKWSALVSFGGGFVGFLGLATVSFTLFSGDEGGSKGTGGSQSSSLEAQAIAKMDTIGLDFFCSKVTDKGVTNVSVGTATGGNGGTMRFPAIKANYTGTCIEQLNGDRDTELVSKFWVFFSLDDEGGQLRCYKVTGDEKEIDEQAAQCNFKPDSA